MWVAGGEHFSFMNQHKAAGKNFKSLVRALVTFLQENDVGSECTGTTADRSAVIVQLNALDQAFGRHAQASVDRAIAAKLGLEASLPSLTPFTTTPYLPAHSTKILASTKIWAELEPLMKDSSVDWTIFWRQLAYAARVFSASFEASTVAEAANEAFNTLSKAFFPRSESVSAKLSETNESHDCLFRVSQGECDSNPNFMLEQCPQSCRKFRDARQRALGPLPFIDDRVLTEDLKYAWIEWLKKWLKFHPNHDIMLLSSPKYIPREWVLVEAYESATRELNKASQNSSMVFSEIARLQRVFSDPYGEQSEETEKRYYRKPPDGLERQGGVGFMS